MSWRSGEVINSQARLRRLSGSIPSSYTVMKIGSKYYAECNVPGGTEYSGTDAATVIQQAIDALTGGAIFFKRGIYEIGTGLTLADAVILKGEGYGEYPYDGTSGGSILKKTANIDLITANEKTAFGIRDLSLYCDKSSYTGKGVYIYSTTGTRPIWWDIQNVIVMRAKGIGLDVNRAGGHWLNKMRILEGDADACQITDSSDWMHTDCEYNAAGTGLDIVTGNGRVLNCKAFTCNLGFSFAASTQMLGGSIVGMVTHGIAISASRTKVIGVDINKVNSDSGAAGSGIQINDVSRCVIMGNTIQDTDSNMLYGIEETGAANVNVIMGNPITGAQTASIITVGAETIVTRNPGYVTENKGTGSVTNGGTTDVIAHGLDVTPAAEDITITGKENPTNDVGTIWVDTIGAANFTVNVENDPGASNWDFGWKAIVI